MFMLNFLSSRKYDWNVAPKDLEKNTARPRRMRRIFFLKKKLFSIINSKRIKSIFQLAFYFTQHFVLL